MANILEYRKTISDLGPMDGRVHLNSPIAISSKAVVMQATAVQLSDRVPNVFDGSPFGIPFNNTKVRVGTDTEAYVTIQLAPGLYFGLDYIEAAINAAINDSLGWWTDPLDPGLKIEYNYIISRAVITIDSTKLAPAFGTQFRFDLRKSLSKSDMYSTLGFSATDVFTVDGAYTSVAPPNLHPQGTSCVIHLSICPQRKRNDEIVAVIATVPLTDALIPKDNIWPAQGQLSPKMVYRGTKNITDYVVEVKTVDNFMMLFLEGNMNMTVAFYETGA
jgi:hypothetical protein